MKRPISIILTLTILCLPPGLTLLRLWLPASTTGVSLPALRGEAALNHLKDRGLYGSLQDAVAAARYGLYQEFEQSGDWQAYNPAQRLRARFTPHGLQVESGGDDGRSHHLGMKLRSAGYGERQMAVSAGRLSAKGNRIEYERTVESCAISAIRNPQSAIIEWYHNTAAGLEQGFTLESAPGGRRDGEWLRVALALEGELRAEVVEGGQALDFRDDGGRLVLRYDHLVVKDGAGRELEARMAVRVDEKEREVWLEVDDRGAVWPVTIDPTFTQQQKLLASDPTAGALFGFSVAISGETVVVGAPLDDSVGDDGAFDDELRGPEGSAYVFMRSGAIWSQQQKLVASDAGVGDFFGESVAISGETVVVGASFDDSGGRLDQGSAYVFVRSGGVWIEQQKLVASDVPLLGHFGSSVAISGETVVAGAYLSDDGVNIDRGSAYVFVRSGGFWSQQKLEASDAAQHDHFGFSVAISGGTVVAGAPEDDGAAGGNQGSAYVFVPLPTNTPPTIAATSISRTQGLPASISTIAEINDAEDDPGVLTGAVNGAASATVNGVTVSSISVDASGQVTASVGAACNASNASFILRVTDSGGLLAEATLNVAVTPDNIAPMINAPEDVSVSTGAGATSCGVVISDATLGAATGADNCSTNLSVTRMNVPPGNLFPLGVTTIIYTATDAAGNSQTATQKVTVIDATLPSLACPSNVVVTLPPNSMGAGMVVNYPAPTATDNCAASPTITTSQASGTFFPLGLTTVNVTATDAANNQATCSFTVAVRYNFSGFFQPVANAPTFNVVNAGRAVPVKFSLSGDKGLNIFAPGSPVSQQIACSDGAPASEIEQTVAAGGSSLIYDAANDRYNYVWKTESSWAGTCRQLIVRLNDGSERVAFFKFK